MNHTPWERTVIKKRHKIFHTCGYQLFQGKVGPVLPVTFHRTGNKIYGSSVPPKRRTYNPTISYDLIQGPKTNYSANNKKVII